jgi:hypothetical protein
VDSKGCTPDGGFPVTSITDNPNYQKLIRCIAGACVPEDGSTSFDAPSTAKRSVTLGVLAGIPKLPELGLTDIAKKLGGLAGKLPIGALVSGVAGLLWPDPTPDALFNQLKDYVDKLVPKAISDEHITDLKGSVEGLKNSLDTYLDARNLAYKGVLLGSLEQNLNTIEPKFFDTRAPEQALAHFVAFATLKLTVLREQYLHGTDYYGDDVDHDLAMCKLNNAVVKYTQAAADIRKRVMDWRLAKLRDDVNRGDYRGKGRGWTWTHQVVDDFCDWRSDKASKKQTDMNMFLRAEQIKGAYGKNLDAILAPIAHWASSTDRAAPALKEQDCHKLPPSSPPSSDDSNSDISNIFEDLFPKQ